MIGTHDINEKGASTPHAFKNNTEKSISSRNADKNGKIDLVKLGLKKKKGSSSANTSNNKS